MNDPPLAAADRDLRVRAYIQRWVTAIIRLDGPAWSSLWRLLHSPGRLAAAQLDGPVEGESASATIHPVRLYLTINVLFFLFAPWVNTANISIWQVGHGVALDMQPAFHVPLDQAIDRSGLEAPIYKVILDQRMSAQQGAWVWLLIPVMALGTFVWVRRRRPFLVEHLVLATHLVSFSLIGVLGVGLVGRLILLVRPGDGRVGLIAALVILIWLLGAILIGYRSLKIFFDLGRFRGLLLGFWLSLVYSLGYWVYMQALFLSALLSLRGLQLPEG